MTEQDQTPAAPGGDTKSRAHLWDTRDDDTQGHVKWRAARGTGRDDTQGHETTGHQSRNTQDRDTEGHRTDL
jgi:hypothetical protein